MGAAFRPRAVSFARVARNGGDASRGAGGLFLVACGVGASSVSAARGNANGRRSDRRRDSTRLGVTPIIGIGSLEECQGLPRLAREARAALDRAIWRGDARQRFDEPRATPANAASGARSTGWRQACARFSIISPVDPRRIETSRSTNTWRSSRNGARAIRERCGRTSNASCLRWSD